MILSAYSIGINISGNRAFVLCLEKTFSGIRIKSHCQVDMDPGEPFDRLVEKTAQYLASQLETDGISAPEIYIGFPRDLSIVRELEFPSSVKEDLASTIRYSLDKYLPLKVEDVGFDCRVVQEDKQNNTIKVVLGAAKKRDLKPFFDLAAGIDSGVSGVEILSTALVNCFSHCSDLSAGRFLLFYADESFLETIVLNNGVFESSHHARIKEDDLFEMVENRIRDLNADKSGASRETGVILCGYGVSAALIEKIETIAGVTVRQDGVEKYDLPSHGYVPAMGLALNGVMQTPFELNLLPAERRKKPSRFAIYSMYLLVFISLLLGVVWGGSYMMHQRMLVSNANSELARLQGEVFEIQKKKDEIARLEKKIATVNTLIADQVSVTDILNELSRVLPSGAWVKGFYFVKGKDLRIDGFAEVASDLIPLIEESDLFKNAVFLSAITRNKDGKERFNIGFELI